MKTFLTTWTGLLLLCFTLHGKEHPNVLLITIDDLNDWIGCFGGHPQSKTPNIDGLAERGIRFTNAHCQAPICNPSRVSFMTGIRPSTSGIYVNNQHFRRSKIMADAITLPQHLKANGYATFGVGKLFHASYIDQPSFTEYGPNPGQGPLPPTKLVKDIKSTSKLWDWGPWPPTNEASHDIQDAEWAVKKLQTEQDKPFFLGVGFYRPHVPFYAPPPWFKHHPLDKVQLPPVKEDDRDDLPAAAKALTDNALPPSQAWMEEENRWKEAVQAYLVSVTYVDHCVGMVVDALDRSAHAENTWIVFLTDHGFFLGEKDRWAKQSLWERATKTPLIIVPPKSRTEWPRGSICVQPVELLDLYPTLLEQCGVPERENLEGISLTPLLKNPEALRDRPAITTYKADNHGIRSRNWRYIRYADGSEELYFHPEDPHEWNNLAGQPEYAHVMARHRGWLPKINQPSVPTPSRKKPRRKQ
ncbi:MAG: sulfatase [Verrucomicrobiota bacterium]